VRNSTPPKTVLAGSPWPISFATKQFRKDGQRSRCLLSEIWPPCCEKPDASNVFFANPLASQSPVAKTPVGVTFPFLHSGVLCGSVPSLSSVPQSFLFTTSSPTGFFAGGLPRCLWSRTLQSLTPQNTSQNKASRLFGYLMSRSSRPLNVAGWPCDKSGPHNSLSPVIKLGIRHPRKEEKKRFCQSPVALLWVL